MSEHTKDGGQVRRADSNERFVAFAFAAADLVAEIDTVGQITYAAGAYRSKFGSLPEAWVGRRLQDMIVESDHHALNAAMTILAERGRLMPWTARLANQQRTEVALAGLRLARDGRPDRMCLTFAVPPSPPARGVQPGAVNGLASAAIARMNDGDRSGMGLLEIKGSGAASAGSTLEALAPGSLTSEIAPGRFGLLGPDAKRTDLVRVAASLESALRDQGVAATVSAQSIPLGAEGLTQRQATRALRRALDAFAQEGAAGVSEAGFEGGLASYVQGAMAHASAMRQAIRDRQFSLLYQPIVHLDSRATHHVEALLRPKPLPGCAAKTPQEFVVLAETVGLALELDLAVAGMACDAAVHSLVPVAFNLSGQSMQEPAFRKKLEALLSDHPARKAKKLAVEMTETAQLEDIAEAAFTAETIRDLGIPFCLDDFGAGAADVRVLRAMPADIVKLDGSYIPGIVTESRDRAFVAGMVEIARAAKAAVVAERVETQAEADAAKAIGVDYGQGWLFGRAGPLPQMPTTPARRQSGKESWG